MTGGAGFEKVLPVHGPDSIHHRLIVTVHSIGRTAPAPLHTDHAQSRSSLLGGFRGSVISCESGGRTNSRRRFGSNSARCLPFRCEPYKCCGPTGCGRCYSAPHRGPAEGVAFQVAHRRTSVSVRAFHPGQSRGSGIGHRERGESHGSDEGRTIVFNISRGDAQPGWAATGIQERCGGDGHQSWRPNCADGLLRRATGDGETLAGHPSRRDCGRISSAHRRFKILLRRERRFKREGPRCNRRRSPSGSTPAWFSRSSLNRDFGPISAGFYPFDFSLQLSNTLLQFRQAIQRCHHLQPLVVINRRISGIHRTRRHVVRHPTLRS